MAAVKIILAVLILLGCSEAFAAMPQIPVPRARPLAAPPAGLPPSRTVPAKPAEATKPAEAARPAATTSPAASNVPAEPSACQVRLARVAVATVLPPVEGPGECGAAELVRLEAVMLADKTKIPLLPAATLRCSMAEAVVDWVREEVAPAALDLGSVLKAIENFDSYDCRGRNRVAGAKISEHGKGNALDVRAIRLANGRVADFTDPLVPKPFRDAMRASACERFTTVLGPGADGYHENHIHVDLAARSHGYRLCQWDVRRDPAVIPLPPDKPVAAAQPAPPRRALRAN